MYGLDLFSGIGGITKALEGYVRPIAYCENDRYAQALLLSRMHSGELPSAPIWDDVRTLRGFQLLGPVDIIYGGFPCQDISVAGRGAGLEGERSGLFFEIVRLVGEIRPAFVFLENVPAIRLRGGNIVVGELARLGYDCRWITLSAADVGANHRRERWWLLAHTNDGTGKRQPWEQQEMRPEIFGSGRPLGKPSVAHSTRWQDIQRGPRSLEEAAGEGEGLNATAGHGGQDVADANSTGRGKRRGTEPVRPEQRTAECGRESVANDDEIRREGKFVGVHEFGSAELGWWSTEPNVGRVAHGIPHRVDRLRALGNSVVPAQAREAFERLLGIK